jgi:hypothetical protein
MGKQKKKNTHAYNMRKQKTSFPSLTRHHWMPGRCGRSLVAIGDASTAHTINNPAAIVFPELTAG